MICIIFLIIEIMSRVFLSTLVGNFIPIKYGFNKDIKIQVYDLSELKIRVVNDNINTSTISNNFIDTNNKKVLWAFGGSTTAGYNCSNKSSSWPEELQKLDPASIEVINFGRNGTNSDFAFIELLAALQNEKPDWVLWANRVNETDVIYNGLGRNKNKFDSTYSENKNFNNIKLYIHRISKTLENYSTFYYIFTDFSKRLMWKLNYRNPEKNIIYENEKLNTAIKNFEYNIIDLIKLSNLYNFKIAIITLVQSDELYNNNIYSDWDNLYFTKIKEVTNLNYVYWINSIEWNYELTNSKKSDNLLFCDGVHQTLEGNKQTSKAIYEKLLKLF